MAEAVGEHGYAGTTVRDVLERARMSRRTFYKLFDNREDCFLATYDQAHHEAMALLERAHEPDQRATGHLAVALRNVLELFAARPGFARLLVVEPASAGPLGLERHERTMRQLTDLLARSGVGAGASADGGGEALALRCEASVGAVHRVVHARLVEGRASELPGLTPQLVGLLRKLGTVS